MADLHHTDKTADLVCSGRRLGGPALTRGLKIELNADVSEAGASEAGVEKWRLVTSGVGQHSARTRRSHHRSLDGVRS